MSTAKAMLFDEPDCAVARCQAALRIPLPPRDLHMPATAAAAVVAGDRLAAAANIRTPRWIFSPDELAAVTGQPTPTSIWGWSDRGRRPALVYVDLAQCETRGVACGVVAHEITHLTHYGRQFSGHSSAWWSAVQHLLDRIG